MSSLPIFYFVKPVSGVYGVLSPEARDDLRDGWRHKRNKKDFDALIGAVIEMRERGNTILVLSGDVHMGAVTEAWYNPVSANFDYTDSSTWSSKKLLATELTTTGLFHAHLQEQGKASIQKWLEASRTGRSTFVASAAGQDYVIDGQYRWSAVRQNFGAFSFGPNGAFVDLFLGIGDTSLYSIENLSPDCEDRFQHARFRINHARTWKEERKTHYEANFMKRSRFFPWKNNLFVPSRPDELHWFTLRRP